MAVAAPSLELFRLEDFSGGWNPRDALGLMAPNESPDCLNVTLDERGGVVKRLGLQPLTSALTNPPKMLYYWPTEKLVIVQDGTTVKATSNFTAFTTVKTFTTADLVGCCDFKSKLLLVHPVDGLYSYTTATGISGQLGTGVGGPPKGTMLATWQNKVWCSGNPADPTNVFWSAAGDETSWNLGATGDFNHIRDVSDAPVTALNSGQSLDIAGNAYLLVWKSTSLHRVKDPSNGSYTTLSTSVGTPGPHCVANLFNQSYFLDTNGIYRTDTVNPPVPLSQKLAPFFTDTQLDLSKAAVNWCAGVYRDRILFSVTRSGASVNDITLEYSPAVGWIVPHKFGISCFARFLNAADALYGGSPTAGKVYNVFKTGSDDGASIDARYQTHWFEPNGGHQQNVRRLIVDGRGQFQLYVRKDYQTSDTDPNAVDITGGGFVWNTDVWNSPSAVWGPSTYENFQDFHSVGVCRSFSFVFRHQGTTSVLAPKLLGDGIAPESGAFACYGLDTEFVRLGFS